MYQKLEVCPLCGNSRYINYLICEDHAVSHESFAIVECDSCHFKFTNPIPSSGQLSQYYESENYISHTNKANSIINLVYKLIRFFTLKRKVGLIEKHRRGKKKRLLDMGCGTGDFLFSAQKAGWQISGVEPSAGARTKAVALTNVEIYKTLEDIDPSTSNKFTAITLWHVLEHVEDLSETIKHLHSLLSKNGSLFIAVPNPMSLDAQIYKQFWAGFDVPRHLYHFTQETMLQLLKKHGFKVANTLPMTWDAYYISLMSEKYKHGSNRYINSFINGYKSNSYAKSNSNNYSSLIYIAHK